MMSTMNFPTDVCDDVQKRLRRVEGQIRAVQRMIDEGADCADVVTQLAAARGALDRVGFKLMASALTCPTGERDLAELERLFVKLS
jgi:DNA-binding FrmR family transcriptional regulator